MSFRKINEKFMNMSKFKPGNTMNPMSTSIRPHSPPPNTNKPGPMNPPVTHAPYVPKWTKDEYYFKKTWRGMVLMIYKTLGPREYWHWRKATEKEAQFYMNRIDRVEYYKELIQSVKETHPEALI